MEQYPKDMWNKLLVTWHHAWLYLYELFIRLVIWGFPTIRVPSNHSFIDRSSLKPTSYWGYTTFLGLHHMVMWQLCPYISTKFPYVSICFHIFPYISIYFHKTSIYFHKMSIYFHIFPQNFHIFQGYFNHDQKSRFSKSDLNRHFEKLSPGAEARFGS